MHNFQADNNGARLPQGKSCERVSPYMKSCYLLWDVMSQSPANTERLKVLFVVG